jgi:hypothetical protein
VGTAPFGSWTTTFTVTNDGTATSGQLTVTADFSDPRFTIPSDECTSTALAPNGTCTFVLSFTAAACPADLTNETVDISGGNPALFPDLFLTVGGLC